ncbi:MAG: hypothetical protein AAF614_16010 [Chloroflexota bacterium]
MKTRVAILAGLIAAIAIVAVAYFVFIGRTRGSETAVSDPNLTAAQPTAAPEELPTLAASTPTPEPTAVPPTLTPEPTPTIEPTATVASLTDSLQVNTIENVLGFASYQFDLVFMFTTVDEAGAEQEQSATVNYRFQQDPPLEGLTAAVVGFQQGLPTTDVQLFNVEGLSYAVLPGLGCVAGMSGLSELAGPFTEIVSPDTLLTNLDQAERILPNETINGILTEHYLFDETALADETSELEWAEGHLYIAADDGYLVKMVIDGEGSVMMIDGAQMENGRLHVEYDLTNIDVPVEIELPEGCVNPNG